MTAISDLISVTNLGPITKDKATPKEPHSAATAVAVVRCSDGNHDADKSGGAAWVTGPARPFNN